MATGKTAWGKKTLRLKLLLQGKSRRVLGRGERKGRCALHPNPLPAKEGQRYEGKSKNNGKVKSSLFEREEKDTIPRKRRSRIWSKAGSADQKFNEGKGERRQSTWESFMIEGGTIEREGSPGRRIKHKTAGVRRRKDTGAKKDAEEGSIKVTIKEKRRKTSTAKEDRPFRTPKKRKCATREEKDTGRQKGEKTPSKRGGKGTSRNDQERETKR